MTIKVSILENSIRPVKAAKGPQSELQSGSVRCPGYDRKIDRLVTFHDVPERRVASVKNIAGVPSSDDGLGSYRPCRVSILAAMAGEVRTVGHDQVVAIARVLEAPIDQGDLAFFLEAFDGNSDQSAATG